MKQPKTSTFLKMFLIIGGLIALPAFYQTLAQVNQRGYNIWRSNRLLLLIAYSLNVFMIVVPFFWDIEKIIEWVSARKTPGNIKKILGILVFLASMSALPYFGVFDLNQFLAHGYPLLWMAWWLGLIAAGGLYVVLESSYLKLFFFSLLGIGVIARVASFLPTISTYPFSLGWSEASRYYYASLFFSERLYGEALPWSFLHPTRYLLQAVPFAFGQLPIWFHRLWQVILWVGISATTGVALARRLTNNRKSILFLSLAAWFFIFLFQGAVYYHLQVCVIIVLLGVNFKRPKQTFTTVLFASLWAGISRVNWYPVPAMLAILLFLLEEPVSTYRSLWHYLLKPILWSITGIGTALVSQSLYVLISGNANNLASFSSSFTSSLLWYRLLPNHTFPPGIIISAVQVSIPVFSILIVAIFRKRQQWHWVRLLGLWSMLFVLFVEGLIVSTKIGGGGDLHNMDAYLVFLGVWAAYMFVQRPASENPREMPTNTVRWGWVIPAILMPLWMSLQAMNPLFSYNKENAEESLAKLREVVTETTERGEEVLFIDQRHLLTFGLVGDASLIFNYEVVNLMEMAMSGNRTYLDTFHQELQMHRFGAIIASPQFLGIKQADESFSEENNTWVKNVSEYLLCEYEPLMKLKMVRIHVFVPKDEPGKCVFSE